MPDVPIVMAHSVDETESVRTLQQQLRVAIEAIEVLVGQTGRMESGVSKLILMQSQLDIRFDELRAEVSELRKSPPSPSVQTATAGPPRRKSSICGTLPAPDRDNYLHGAFSRGPSSSLLLPRNDTLDGMPGGFESRRSMSSLSNVADDETQPAARLASSTVTEATHAQANSNSHVHLLRQPSVAPHVRPPLRPASSRASPTNSRSRADAAAAAARAKSSRSPSCTPRPITKSCDEPSAITTSKRSLEKRPTGKQLTRSLQVMEFLAKNQEVGKTLHQLKEQHKDQEHRTERNLGWIQENKHKCWFRLIIPHYDPYRQKWDLLLFGLVLVSVYLVPMQIAFDFTSIFWMVLGWCFDAAFSFDVLLNFFTTYDEDGVTVFQFKLIAVNYLRSWFVIDIISVIPIDQLVGGGNSSVGRLNKLIRLIRMFKLLRVFRLYRLTKAGAISRFLERASPSTLRLAMVVVITFTVLHILACFYWMVVEIEWVFLDTPAERVEVLLSAWFPPRYVIEETGMLTEETDMLEVLALLPPEYAYDVNFTVASGFGAAYVWSFFWATSAASGYQDFLPATALQSSFTLFVVIFGFLGSAVILGSVTTALSEMNAISAKHKQKMEEIQQYLRVKEVPKRVRRAIADFYSFAGAGDSANEDLEDLPANLRLQLDIVLNRSLFLKVPAFRECTPGQICELVPRIVRQYALRSQFIVEQGGEALGLYMIARGTVEVLSDHEHVGMLGRNEFFGEQSILSDMLEENAFKAAEITELMVLFRNDLNEVMELFPELRDTLRKHAIMRDKRRQEASRVLSLWKFKKTLPEVEPSERKQAASGFLEKWRTLVDGEKGLATPSCRCRMSARLSRRASNGPRGDAHVHALPQVGSPGSVGSSSFKRPLLKASISAARVMPLTASTDVCQQSSGDAVPFAMLRWRRRAAERASAMQESAECASAFNAVDPSAPNSCAYAPATEHVVVFHSEKESDVRVVDVSVS